MTAAPTRRRWLRQGSVKRTLERDVETGKALITVTRDDGLSEIEAIGTITGLTKTLRYWIDPEDPPRPGPPRRMNSSISARIGIPR